MLGTQTLSTKWWSVCRQMLAKATHILRIALKYAVVVRSHGVRRVLVALVTVHVGLRSGLVVV